jgi:hypothetical protein
MKIVGAPWCVSLGCAIYLIMNYEVTWPLLTQDSWGEWHVRESKVPRTWRNSKGQWHWSGRNRHRPSWMWNKRACSATYSDFPCIARQNECTCSYIYLQSGRFPLLRYSWHRKLQFKTSFRPCCINKANTFERHMVVMFSSYKANPKITGLQKLH